MNGGLRLFPARPCVTTAIMDVVFPICRRARSSRGSPRIHSGEIARCLLNNGPIEAMKQITSIDQFPVEHVSIHGHQIGYRRGGEGPVLLLLHGIAGSSLTWVPAMRLMQDDYAVLAPDFLGHGAPEKPLGDYSLGVAQHLVSLSGAQPNALEHTHRDGRTRERPEVVSDGWFLHCVERGSGSVEAGGRSWWPPAVKLPIVRVLLTDGSGLTARQVATELSLAGHRVEVLTPDPLALT